ncbi:ABC transporter substrate-binding protein [Oleispirillum naphthae]|uniref:ABC transporter substrate-binding protein n=1 Tax=Oleispirillum naphthae TaxID=2838853 RepID=UPI00308223BB
MNFDDFKEPGRFKGYGRGAVVLAAVGILAVIASRFSPDPGVLVEPGKPAPADTAPGCAAAASVPGPAAFASAPDPRGIAVRHVFDRLVEYDRRSGRIVPGLATRWEVSDEGTTYTFILRHGVAFHAAPGFSPRRYFDARDVLHTFGALMKENRNRTDTDYARAGMGDLLEMVSKTETDRVVFHLSVAYPRFLANLSMDFASIRSAEYADAMEAAGTPQRIAAHPVGTGPLVVAETGKRGVLYAANPRYWGDVVPGKVDAPTPRQVVPPSIYGID